VTRHYPHILVLCVLGTLLYGGLLGPFQDALTDFRFRTVQRPASGQVVVVAIDPPSLQDIGVWPWPRRFHAELVRKLQGAGVTDIVFDVDFSARSSPADDAAFADALREAGGAVVLAIFKQATTKSDAGPRLHVNRALPQFRAHAWDAAVNVSVEVDGRVRRYAFGDEIDGEFVPSAATMLASGTFSKNARPFYLDHSIRLSGIPVVSYSDVLNGKVGAASLRGKRVVVGGTAIELGDRYHVPNTGIISGPKLHALAAESILQGRALATTSNAVTTAGLAALVLLMLVLMLWKRLGLSARTITLVCLAIAIEATATVLQARTAIIVDTAVWHAAILAYLTVGWLSEIDLRGMLARIAKQRFQSIAMSLRDGVACADRRGVVTFWNPAAASIYGFSPAEAVGRPFADFCKVRDPTDAAQPLVSAEPAAFATLFADGRVPEFVGVRKNGETFPLEVSLSAWPDLDGFQYGAVLRDISERKREEEQMRHLAMHDSLTGLLNRAGMRSALSIAVAKPRGEAATLALILIDLDDFKDINDTLGHQAGDEVLRQVANGLRAVARADDLVGRLGGDEFAIVVEGTDAATRAGALAKTIAGTLRQSCVAVDGRPVFTRATVGLAIAGPQGQTLDELLANADLALYRAKGAERGSCVVYDAGLRHELEQRRTLEKELGQAVARGEFELFYQPQVRLRDNAVVGVEALLRWRHPARGLLAPGQFLEVLNATALSNEVGTWVLKSACRQGHRWHRMNRTMRVGVNLAPSQFRSDLPALVERVLGETGLPPALLELEVTEDILLDQDGAAEELLRRIRAMGVGIAFDDFGTGYASLTHLRRFSLDRLKIDRSFVRDLGTDTESAAIVAGVAGLGKRLGISVIAEGVEDAQLLAPLLEAGCDEGQGYLFGKPMPADRIEQMLAAKQDCTGLVATAA
jgi:diguanylate cyclase (GGDEF)-like protein/PAS domain S-box-containing protein